MNKLELSQAIAVAYHDDCLKPELIAVKTMTRNSRKFGFPIVCEIATQPQNEQILWAAKLLLKVMNSWPSIDSLSVCDFELIPGSQLHTDALQFTANALSNTERLDESKNEA